MRKPMALVLWAGTALIPLLAFAGNREVVVRDWEDQYRRIEKQIKDGAKNQAPEAQMLDRNALILPADHDPLDVVIRRTKALLLHLRTTLRPGTLDELERQLAAVVRRCDTRTAPTMGGAKDTMNLYLEIRDIARRAAFSNPLLDFDDILFVERKSVGEDNFSGGHMTTASFGHTQLYGSGLYIVRNIKSDSPMIVSVVKDSVIANGPWKGEKLTGGAFLSPELSCDGKEILFAYAKPVYANKPRV